MTLSDINRLIGEDRCHECSHSAYHHRDDAGRLGPCHYDPSPRSYAEASSLIDREGTACPCLCDGYLDVTRADTMEEKRGER